MAQTDGATVPKLSKKTKNLSKRNECCEESYLSPTAFKVLFLRKLRTALSSGTNSSEAIIHTIESPEIADWFSATKIADIVDALLHGTDPMAALARLDVFSEYDIIYIGQAVAHHDLREIKGLSDDYETFLRLDIV